MRKNSATGIAWSEANQRYLMATLREVRLLLERYARQLKSEESIPEPTAKQEAAETSADMTAPPALETLCEIFGLSPFERQVLLLCAGLELDGSFASVCAAAQGDLRRNYPSFSLALAALPDAHWSALTPAAPLRYWRLVEVAFNGTLTTSPLRIDERILHYLAGVSHIDERLMGILEPVTTLSPLVASHELLAGRIVDAWSNTRSSVRPVIQLCGQDASDRHDVAAVACARLGLRLSMLPVGSLPTNSGDLAALERLWEREAALSGSALLLECHDLNAQDAAIPNLTRIVERMRNSLIVSCRERLCKWQRPTITIEVEKPLQAEQRELWQKTMNVKADHLIDTLVPQFNLSSRDINNVAGTLSTKEATQDDQAKAMWDACRMQSRPRLENLAQRIEPVDRWDDLVLPALQMQILREIAVHVRQRARVYGEWGFAARSTRGLGISALFEGASGTGKTMAAEVLANELRLDLYRIDLSQVVSKYIGETEKNLRQVFDAAESGGAILLFDEADALFGKRSEIKDSHDRYANIEVSYLLQRMESYRGLAILTTNMKSALDSAFLRRIRFVVQFPFPDASFRAEIWRRVFPCETPTDVLDINKLARLNIAGGSIRNIALNAAFLAAGDGGLVRMTHLLQATRSEYAKLEKPLSAAEIGGWV
jgi:SpoVK/Ycf46/Vps4 family AAA+-type ATPase